MGCGCGTKKNTGSRQVVRKRSVTPASRPSTRTVTRRVIRRPFR